MIVKCKTHKLSKVDLNKLGEYYITGWEPASLDIGKNYLVYSISFKQNVLWVYLLYGLGLYLTATPIYYFDIIDSKIPNIWEVSFDTDRLHIAPKSFFQKFYYDDLIEGVPEVVADFNQKRKLIEEDLNFGN